MACWTRHTALNTTEKPEAMRLTARCKPPGGTCHCKHNLNVQNSPAAKLFTVIHFNSQTNNPAFASRYILQYFSFRSEVMSSLLFRALNYDKTSLISKKKFPIQTCPTCSCWLIFVLLSKPVFTTLRLLVWYCLITVSWMQQDLFKTILWTYHGHYKHRTNKALWTVLQNEIYEMQEQVKMNIKRGLRGIRPLI